MSQSSAFGKIMSFLDLKSIIIAVIIALTFRALLFEPYKIPSGSMFPTLMIGDRLFISKFSYGYSKYSIYGLPLIKERILFTEPKRGDIIIFKHPKDQSINYIKRLIGLPGDEIQIIGGNLYINNKLVPRTYIGKWNEDTEFSVYEENLQGIKHKILMHNNIEPSSFFRNTKKYIVPAAHYFFMGDNRDNSIDSRFDAVDFVPRQNLLGKALFLFWTNDMSFAKPSLGRNLHQLQ